jgi:hypothetical protein
MRTLIFGPRWVAREYAEHRLVQLIRHHPNDESALLAEAAFQNLTRRLQDNYECFGIVIDLRKGPIRSDLVFEADLRRVAKEIGARFARVAILVGSQTGVSEVTRVVRNECPRAFVTMNETSAFEVAKGLAVTRRRTDDPNPMRTASPDPVNEASRWANALDGWAVVRERVLSKIDLRAARRARSLASEIRRAVDTALDLVERASGDIATLSSVLDELAALRIEAVELMLGGVPVAAERPNQHARM